MTVPLPADWTECPACGVALKRRGLGAHKGSKKCTIQKRHVREQRIHDNRVAREERRFATLTRRGFARVFEGDRPLPASIHQVTVETRDVTGMKARVFFAPEGELVAARFHAWFQRQTKGYRRQLPLLQGLNRAGRLWGILLRRVRTNRDFRARLLSVRDLGETWEALAEFLEETVWGAAR